VEQAYDGLFVDAVREDHRAWPFAGRRSVEQAWRRSHVGFISANSLYQHRLQLSILDG
jgi:hypothetical protein